MAQPNFVRTAVGTANFSNSLTVSIDLGSGANRALMVLAMDNVSGPTRYPVSCSVGGVAMTATALYDETTNGTKYMGFSLGSAGGLPTGVQNIVLTMNTGSSVGYPGLQAILYDSTTAISAAVPGRGFSGTMSKSVATTNGQLVVAQHFVDGVGNVITPAGTAVERLDAAGFWQNHAMELLVTSSTTPTVISAGLSPNGVWWGFGWALTGTAGAPTTVTISGPSSGVNGVASTNFTVGTDNPVTSGSVIVTPSDGGAGGTFTPTTVTLTSASPSGTFTYTPASTGSKSITLTNNGALTNPSAWGYTVSAGGDTTRPTLTGSIAQGVTTTTSIKVTWPTGSDNVGIVGYDVSKDGGATWVSSNGATSTTAEHTFTGLSAGTAYPIQVVARDAAGNLSTPPLSATLSTSSSGSSQPTFLVGASSYANFADTATLNVNLGAGVNRAVLVMVLQTTAGGTHNPTGATCGGVAMTPTSLYSEVVDGIEYKGFYLQGASVPSGAQDIVVSMDTTGNTGHIETIVAVYDNTSAVGSPVNAAGFSATEAWTVPTVAGNVVAALACLDGPSSTVTPTSGVTQRLATAFYYKEQVFDKAATTTSTLVSAGLSPNGVWWGIAWPLTGITAPATTTTLTGPTSGPMGAASANFTVGTDNGVTSSLVVTPSDASAGGTFTPATVTLTAGSPTATFTYTPSSPGAKSITLTNNGSLTNPAAWGYLSNDTSIPVMGGAIVPSTITTNSYTLTWPPATDNVGVAGYELSLDAGATYFALGLVLTTNVSGRTPGATDPVRVRAFDAAGNRATPTALDVTLLTSGDPTRPTLTGSITISSLTTSSYTAAWPAGADNVAVVRYDYSLDGGATWVSNGLSLSVNISGRTGGSTDQFRVRAADAAGNLSTPVLSQAVTLLTATLTSDVMSNDAGSVLATTAVVWTYTPAGHTIGSMTGATLYEGANSTNAAGRLVLAGVLPAGSGELWVKVPSTGAVFFQPVTVA